MLIKQIIEFEWEGTGPHGHTCTPKTSYFHEKTTKLQRVDFCYLVLKYCLRQSTLLLLVRAKSLAKFNPKI